MGLFSIIRIFIKDVDKLDNACHDILAICCVLKQVWYIASKTKLHKFKKWENKLKF